MHCKNLLKSAQRTDENVPELVTPDTSIGTLESKDGAASKETVAKICD